LAFIELRDREGLLQVFVDSAVADFDKLHDLHKESILAVTGEIVARDERFVNPHIKSGQVELRAETIEIIASSKLLPFELDNHAHA
ncbi:OB-fold nucleic acid binding domain-containing protein, partial [Pseudomonas aeruginosa]